MKFHLEDNLSSLEQYLAFSTKHLADCNKTKNTYNQKQQKPKQPN